jgi:hypothetical protein
MATHPTDAPPSASPLDEHTAPTATTARRPGKAIAALVLGILSIPCALFPIVGAILGAVAIALGSNARSQIRRSGLDGEGQAHAGVILGIVGLSLAVILFVVRLVVLTS